MSYSCVQNVATIIRQYSNQVHRNQQQDGNDQETRNCNRHIKDQCPLEGEYLTGNLVYKEVVTSGIERNIYTGLTNPKNAQYLQDK